MLAAFFGAAMVLTLSVTTAIAETVSVRQQTPLASTHVNVASSNGPQDRSAQSTTDEEHRQTVTDARTTQSPDSDPEPESIAGGSEP
jgi:hypothetical protein